MVNVFLSSDTHLRMPDDTVQDRELLNPVNMIPDFVGSRFCTNFWRRQADFFPSSLYFVNIDTTHARQKRRPSRPKRRPDIETPWLRRRSLKSTNARCSRVILNSIGSGFERLRVLALTCLFNWSAGRVSDWFVTRVVLIGSEFVCRNRQPGTRTIVAQLVNLRSWCRTKPALRPGFHTASEGSEQLDKIVESSTTQSKSTQ